MEWLIDWINMRMVRTCCPNRFSMSLVGVIHKFDLGLVWHSIIHVESPIMITSLSVGRKIWTNPDSENKQRESLRTLFFNISYFGHCLLVTLTSIGPYSDTFRIEWNLEVWFFRLQMSKYGPNFKHRAIF